MKFTTIDCPLVGLSKIEGNEIVFDLQRIWPFNDIVSDEHITYALVMALKRFYENVYTGEMSKYRFIDFVANLMMAHIRAKTETLLEPSSDAEFCRRAAQVADHCQWPPVDNPPSP